MMILFGFYDYYRLEVDVILYLIQYAISGGNRSFRYMEKIAEDWSDHQIDSVEQAQEYTMRYQIYLPIFKALGIPYHNPNDQEQESVDRWLYTYHMSPDLITEAARRTVRMIGKPSFKYMEGILLSWYQQQVKNLSDVESLDLAYRSARTAAQSSGADYARGTNQINRGSSSPRKGSYFVASNTPYYDYATYESTGYEVDDDMDKDTE